MQSRDPFENHYPQSCTASVGGTKYDTCGVWGLIRLEIQKFHFWGSAGALVYSLGNRFGMVMLPDAGAREVTLESAGDRIGIGQGMVEEVGREG